MKKKTWVLYIALGIVAGISFAIWQTKVQSSKDTGLYETYKSAHKLYENANIVVRGKINNKPESYVRQLETKVHEDLYELEIVEVIKNDENDAIKKGDILSYSILTKMEIGEQLMELDYVSLSNSTYLLFLNVFDDTKNNEVIYVNASPGHVYQEVGKKYKNIASNNVKTIKKALVNTWRND